MLTFPEELHALTFNLLSGLYIQHLDVNITARNCLLFVNDYTHFINMLIYNTFAKHKVNWLLCHRQFELQWWKIGLTKVSSYWIGYEFECFQSQCESYGKCKTILSKSPVNYIIIFFLGIIVCYFPILFYILPECVQSEQLEKKLANYKWDDTPISLSRLYLNLIKRHYECWEFQMTEDNILSSLFILLQAPETLLLSILLSLSFAAIIIQDQMMQNLPEDQSRFKEIYSYHFFSDNKVLNILKLCFTVIVISFASAFISLNIYIILYIKNVCFIKNPWDLWDNLNISRHICIKDEDSDTHIIPSINKIFVNIFIKRLRLLLKSSFYVSMFHPLGNKMHCRGCKMPLIWIFRMLKVILYFLFTFVTCFFPIFYFIFGPVFYLSKVKSLDKFRHINRANFVIVNICSIISVFLLFFLFVPALSFLLRFILFNIFIVIPMHNISLKFWVIVMTASSYLKILYTDFYGPYKELMSMCIFLYDDKSHIIPVKKYWKVANVIYPLGISITFLIGKLIMLAIILIVVIFMMTYGVGGDSFVHKYLPILFFILSPAIVMKLNRIDPKEEVNNYSELIKVMLREDESSESDDHNYFKIQGGLKVIVIFFFPFYLIFLSMYNVLSFCFDCNLKYDTEEICPDTCRIHFDIGNSNGESPGIQQQTQLTNSGRINI